MKGVGALKVRQTLVKYLQWIMVISKIKYESFWFQFFIILNKKIYYFMFEKMKGKAQKRWIYFMS